MKIYGIGVGAVGGYFGGKLAKAGLDVTFISRDKTLDALKKDGLRIESYTGNFTIKKPNVAHDFKTLADADLILLCVKSYSTKEVAKALKDKIKDDTIIISMQNGIENEDIIAKTLGADRVIGSVVFITSSMPKYGLIKHTSFGKIILGELNGEITDRVKKFERMFLDAGIPVGVTTNIKKELWKKLMLNIPYNGFTSVVRGALSNYFQISEAQECFLRALKEVQQVAQMEGLYLTDDDVESALIFTKAEGFTTFKSSTLQDIEAGKPLEIEALLGAVIRAANKHNVDVPINKLLYALLKMSYDK